MQCQRAVVVKAASSAGFGVRETAGGMALGLLLLGAGMTDLSIVGPKWDFGDCHCQARPTLAAAIPFPAAPSAEPERSGFTFYVRSIQLNAPAAPPATRAWSAADPLPSALAASLPAALPAAQAAYAESPLPVASPELAGARVGAEPTLGLSAFPSADPYQSEPAAQAPRRAFADAPGLEATDDALMPARRR